MSELDFDLVEDNEYAQEIREVMRSENKQHNQLKDRLNSNNKDYSKDYNNKIHYINNNDNKRANSNLTQNN